MLGYIFQKRFSSFKAILLTIFVSGAIICCIVQPTLAAIDFQSSSFSEEELKEIEKRWGKIALNRINDYHQTIGGMAGLEEKEKLFAVNDYLNKLLPEYDDVRNNKEEHWGTPKEFLSFGTGDCEDYVAIKYFALQELGVAEEKLFFAIVKDTFSGNHHMVLLYQEKEGQSPLVLDNLSFRLLPLHKRTDLVLVDFFNQTGRYHYTENFNKIRQTGGYALFQDLLDRVRSGR